MSGLLAFVKSNFRKIALLLLCLVFITAFLTFFLGYRGLKTLQWGMAESLRWQTETLVQRFNISSENHKEISRLVNDYAAEIEAGNVWFWHGTKVLQAFYDGPVFYALVGESLNNRLNEIDSSAVADVPDRFFSAAANAKIASATIAFFRPRLLEKRTFNTSTSTGLVLPEKVEVFKKNLSPDELLECCEKMAEVLPQKTENQAVITLDAVAELRKILAKP